MPTVTLITGHVFDSDRRAGFHFLADAFARAGWDVLFFTAAFSCLSVLRRDRRASWRRIVRANRLERVNDRVQSFMWFTPTHPANLRRATLNRWSTPMFRRYGHRTVGEAEEIVARSELMIVESGPGLVLCTMLDRLNPRARRVYRVSDDVRLLGNHPVVLDAEQQHAPRFQLISVPSSYLFNRFCEFPTTRLQHHGLDGTAFDRSSASPYPEGAEKNVVFVGAAYLDKQFLQIASGLKPKWKFHVIGPVAPVPKAPNIRAYGEMPFSETVRYIQHADAGMHTLAHTPGAESFTDSLKVIQYTYCKLPVIAPEFLRTSRANTFYYTPANSKSMLDCLDQVAEFDSSAVAWPHTRSWDDLATELAND